MKKLLAILMCASLVLCASCGKKAENDAAQEGKAPETVKENKVENAVENIDKKIAENPADVGAEDINAAKESAKEIEEELKEKAGTVKEEDVEQYQNQQVSVAILQQGLEALEKAKESGDEKAIEEAQQMIDMAKSLWDFEQE